MSNQYLKLRRSGVPGKIPTTESIDFGEIALNTYDGLAFMKRSGSNGVEVVPIGSPSGSFFGDFTGTFSGSFSGSGADLSNIPASAIVGLNLSQIASGSYSASISDAGLLVNTRVVAESFTGSLEGTASWAENAQTASYVKNAQTASYVLQAVSASFALAGSGPFSGSFSGSGADLSDIPASAIVGLNLSQITSGSYSASISEAGLLVNNRVVADSFTGSFSGNLFGTASWAENALTASFITASNVYGPFGANSILSASYAQTASYAKNLIVSGSISTVDYIDFTTTDGYPHLEGRVHWNDDVKTLQIDTDRTNFSIDVGHQSIVRVYNDTGVDINSGSVVYINGAQGNTPTVAKASWDIDPTSAGTIGFAATTIPGTGGNRHGYVVTNGLLTNVNTNGFAVGTRLYLSSSGQFTDVAPDAPLHEVRLGVVVVNNATTGVIYVNVVNGFELTELHDVKTTAEADGDLLVRSGSLWINSKELNGNYSFIGNQTISGSLIVRENLTVLGSASMQYISESTLNIGTNLITVNTFNPGARFGGLAVIDSGSSPLISASFLYDSVQDEFIFVHKGTAGGVLTSSVFLLGPETYNDVGNEIYLTANRIPKGTGIEHLNDSNISDNGSVVSINSNTQVTGSLIVTQGISGSFSGSGADLSNIPASAIVGLNLSQIASGSYSASIANDSLLVNTNVVATSFSGSFSGSGTNLYDIPVTAITGLGDYDGFNVTQSFSSPSSTWTFNHNLNSQYVVIQTYDTSDNQIIPENIQLFNANSAVITFPTLEAGYAIATIGGGTINNITVNISGSSGSFATTGSNTFIGNQLITGSVQVTGGTIIGTLTGNADTATTASYAETASYVENAQTASFVQTAQTASYVLNAQTASYVQLAESASFVTTAATASFANTLYNTDGTITAARTITLGNNPLTIAGLSNSNRFFANGNIGIGTLVDGGSNLNVSGSALIDGTLVVNSNTGIGTPSNASFRLDVSGSSSRFQSSLIVSGTLDVVGTTTSRFFANGNVAVGTTTDVASAILQVTSTAKGFLPPRMTTAQRDAISGPTAGLIIYNTSTNKHQGYNGTTWNDFF